ncbi:hypothetical protein ZIOFF_031075 [Zingiber officinale]|uniref:Uncharacterized protein n=1 Tax=Zingiber officinale TaxID=94328 RepID=A0A8J5LCA9_ZINOF|nr:hypothetical protein ZIOFF_031075 [Zingiber officinale]
MNFDQQVEVEVLVVEGPKLQTVLSQVRKLETSVLVLSQCKPSLFCWYTTFAPQLQQQIFSLQTKSPFRAKSSKQCIDEAQCLTMAVRKQSMGVGGYLVSTRWKKNFWLLA